MPSLATKWRPPQSVTAVTSTALSAQADFPPARSPSETAISETCSGQRPSALFKTAQSWLERQTKQCPVAAGSPGSARRELKQGEVAGFRTLAPTLPRPLATAPRFQLCSTESHRRALFGSGSATSRPLCPAQPAGGRFQHVLLAALRPRVVPRTVCDRCRSESPPATERSYLVVRWGTQGSRRWTRSRRAVPRPS